MNARFRPLRWSGPATPAGDRRSWFSFKASWPQTLELLQRELGYLDATDVVIEADFREQDLRLDGWPRANARQPEHPGIRLAFGSKHGPLIYATDAYQHWQHNVRAIALGLEALRAVDRYGVTRSGEQYRGWVALEAAPAQMDEVAARSLLDSYGGLVSALRKTHPDTGGSADQFHRVQEARHVLGL